MKSLFTAALLFFAFNSTASHLVGGNISYKHLNGNNYEITITQYRDCRSEAAGGGNPAALIDDNPLYLSVFDANQVRMQHHIITSNSIVAFDTYADEFCVKAQPYGCYSRIIFTTNISLPPNGIGYYLVTQRCCWVGGFANLNQIAANGMNTMTFISNDILTITKNNSARFKHDLNKVFCIGVDNQTLDCSAVDDDGDSLTYELCHLNSGGGLSQIPNDPNSPKPNPIPPGPYKLITYETGYTFDEPLKQSAVNFSFNNASGQLVFKPTLLGNYHIGICCTEWRNGQVIQTNERNVIIRIEECIDNVEVNAFTDVITPFDCIKQIEASGGNFYNWSILPLNQNTIYFDDSTLSNPTILFKSNSTKTSGNFKAVVKATNLEGFSNTDTLDITITDKSYFIIPNAFSPNGDGINDYLRFMNSGNNFEFIRIFNRWGNKVFESNSPDFKWDGTYKGTKVNPNSYFWVARIRDKQQNRITKKGTVIVVR